MAAASPLLGCFYVTDDAIMFPVATTKSYLFEKAALLIWPTG
jgi:hypothetical protein